MTALVFALSASAAADFTGTYAGQWTSKDGASGKYVLMFTRADGGWKGTVSGGIDNQPIHADLDSLQVQDNRFRASYTVEVNGKHLTFQISGTRSEDGISGDYHCTSGGKQTDTGTWQARWVHAQPRIRP